MNQYIERYTDCENECLRDHLRFDRNTAREIKNLLKSNGGGYVNKALRSEIETKLDRIIKGEYC